MVDSRMEGGGRYRVLVELIMDLNHSKPRRREQIDPILTNLKLLTSKVKNKAYELNGR